MDLPFLHPFAFGRHYFASSTTTFISENACLLSFKGNEKEGMQKVNLFTSKNKKFSFYLFNKTKAKDKKTRRRIKKRVINVESEKHFWI